VYVGSVANLLVKRSALQAQQTALAAYIGTAPYNALSASQKANLQAQNTAAQGTITAMTAKVLRKTGHS
jgi:hypothetical protein